MAIRRAGRRRVLTEHVIQRWPEKNLAEKRYKEFVEPFLPKLTVLARVFSNGNKHLADDMLQEATIRIVAEANRWDPKRGSKKTFVFGVAKHLMLDLLRAEASHKKHFHQVWSDDAGRLLEIIDKAKSPWEEVSEPERESRLCTEPMSFWAG
ncbi:MAG: hypothetical protein JW744_05055 [Candidatus Diapherotrites archaeon]|uniref:RNA polymerase sigma-70 region 2 domain-containing protein n=1 Tax=Candidatus Iainarchaeum sp. TaxID=3101447 RepID=A0A938YPB1_9ARCH|nr:hypothetical protein [Candidatus Diapherotrites archaeon]